MLLTLRFGWDFNQVQAQPSDYLEELSIAMSTREAMIQEQKRKDDKMAEWRARNAGVLGKQGLRPA